MTLTLAQLTADLSRIHAHGLAETNVIEIRHAAGGSVFFAVDTSELEADLADAKASEARLEAELKTAEEERDRLDKENEKLVEMHEELKDPDSGITPWAYKQQTEEALKWRDDYRTAMLQARDERDALRKRKGVTCELFKHGREIENFLQLCSTGTNQPGDLAKLATELRAKLYTP